MKTYSVDIVKSESFKHTIEATDLEDLHVKVCKLYRREMYALPAIPNLKIEYSVEGPTPEDCTPWQELNTHRGPVR